METKIIKNKGFLVGVCIITVVVTSGLLVAAAPGIFSWPGFSFGAFIAFTPLLIAKKTLPPKWALFAALGVGFFTNLGFCLWYPGLMARYSDLHPITAVGLTAVILFWQAMGWGVWMWLLQIGNKHNKMPLSLFAPASFVIIERWMPVLFPYSIGLSQYRQLTLIQITELGGPYVLTFLVILASVLLSQIILWSWKRDNNTFPVWTLIWTLCVLSGVWIFGTIRLEQIKKSIIEAPAIRIALIQPDVIKKGWTIPPPNQEILEDYQRISAELEATYGPFDLLVWPEKGYPLVLRHDARHDYPIDNPRRIRQKFKSPLLFGVTSVDSESREIFNSAALLDREGKLNVWYDKVQLIFFSEWLPDWASGWFKEGLRYTKGTRLTPLELNLHSDHKFKKITLSVFICFESCFPDHIRQLMSYKPHLLLNISDDSWFGNTAEPEQHLSQSVFRAIESRRFLVRSSASGVSAIISATGNIESRIEINHTRQDKTLVAAPRLLELNSIYSVLGDLFSYGCIVLTLLGLLLEFRKRRHLAISSEKHKNLS